MNDMQLIFVTPYQACVVYAALQQWREEMEGMLHADASIDESNANNNNLLSVICSLEESNIIMNQIQKRFGIVENE